MSELTSRRAPVVAIVGATGAVGGELLRCLEQRRVHLVRYHVGIDKDARTYDAAHHDHGGVEQTELAAQLRRGQTPST